MHEVDVLASTVVGKLFSNNKTGAAYLVTSVAIECTNGSDGFLVTYTDGCLLYSREHDEFRRKFTEIEVTNTSAAEECLSLFAGIQKNTRVFARVAIARHQESEADIRQPTGGGKREDTVSSGCAVASGPPRKRNPCIVNSAED
jgi:hypothetical protein